MDAVSIIAAKRDGKTLSRDQLDFFISGFVSGEIPDYQMSALLMAICLRGMELRETVELTQVMIDSGERVDLSPVPGRKVDKHSTGGVGDKTTLVVAPLVASAGLAVAKLSGRGLGHTGGTLDKLESIPGLRSDLDRERFVEQVARIGVAVAGQSDEIVPADKKMYALRDVTATVGSTPLITSSVASKKIAGGADAIVLDVKAGSGALIGDLNEARLLARWLVEAIGRLGRKAVALVTGMDEPLGRAVGNALEVKEAIGLLRGQGPEDLRLLCLELAARMLVLGGKGDLQACRDTAARRLGDGSALSKFAEMVEAQEGDPRVVDEPDAVLPRAAATAAVTSQSRGFVTSIDAMAVGRASMLLGAGRAKAGESIDPAAGVLLGMKVGEEVRAGEELALMHASGAERFAVAGPVLSGAFELAQEPPAATPLVIDVLE